MSHPSERGSYMKAINTQILKEIDEARIRQLRMAYWNEPSKGRRPSFDIVLSLRPCCNSCDDLGLRIR